ncbi:uncharacterized protein LOC120090853 [Benincasa hispida]|uniref:uncharacterized protein LOC120090853 n=1 Tax=Benincasa hispida TaxID=102211 RepID=UPI001900B119|nr:uncharacterized protein LOC120090853 [Benincasa hispida]
MEVEEVKGHEHSLTFYQRGIPDRDGNGEDVRCSQCNQPWRPPAFGCSTCNFHIHQSCINLPNQISTPFHPQNHQPLHLTNHYRSCKCCRQMPSGKVYSCLTCGFHIDLQCLIAKTKASGLCEMPNGKFRHFAHPHPLTTLNQDQQRLILQRRKYTKIIVCVVCQLPITSGSDNSTTDSDILFCSHCDLHFHHHCANLPREIEDPKYHQHSLFLFPRSFVNKTFCSSCSNERAEFFYTCPSCDFNLHVACLRSFKHQHEFINLRKILPFQCQACGKLEKGFPWFCSICHVFIHKKCAESASSLKTSEHRHSLTLTFSLNPEYVTNYRCKICGKNIKKSCAAYVCYQCESKYITHLDCAKNRKIDNNLPREAVDEPINIEKKINQENGMILHFSHSDKLILCSGEGRLCDGCMRCISTPSISYGCLMCSFFLHEECAKLPRNRNCLFHPHLLRIIYIPDFVWSCSVCFKNFHGFAYQCTEGCHFIVDIGCVGITIPFTHPSHNHPLFIDRTNKKQTCGACGESVENKEAFRCVECNFYLDATCATLPLKVRFRFDMHPLNLTFKNEDEGNEYYCDICEEERKAEQWFYSCKSCFFAAHLNCVLGDYPCMKSAKFNGHQHPLNLVKKGKIGYSTCGACGNSCDVNMAFECGICKFNVHAFGPCYHLQLTRGEITMVTMSSLRSRSFILCSDT